MRQKSILLMGLIIACLSSCFNKADEEKSEESDIPITLSTSIEQSMETRSTKEKFDENSTIGFYLLLDNQKELNTAHIQNAQFILDKNKVFYSKEALYYPKSKSYFKVYGYHPYAPNVLNNEDGTIRITVEDNQSTIEKFQASNFLFCYKDEVVASTNALKLDFKHKTSKIRISLVTEPPYTTEDIFNTHPTVRLINFPTTANFNPITKEITNFSTYKEITPYIKWKIENNKMAGCEALIIATNSEISKESYIMLEAENIKYKATIPPGLILKAEVVNHIIINYNPSKGIEVSYISGGIDEWNTGVTVTTESKEIKGTIMINELKFDNSNVIQLINKNGDIRAEVCKEYLKNDEINGVGVVLYPYKEKAPQLTKGILLAMVNKEILEYDGGAISWTPNKNTFTYTPSRESPYRHFYFNTDGEFKNDEPVEAEIINAQPLYYVEKEKNITTNYPVVKLGTHFWMQKNLNSSLFTDGKEMASAKDVYVLNPGYSTFKNYPNEKLYNRSALLAIKLLNKPWKIPEEEDWIALINYTGNSSIMYKNKSWQNNNKENNITGFSVAISGLLNKLYYITNSAFFAAPKNPETNNVTVVIFNQNTDEIKVLTLENEVMSSIRAIRDLNQE